MKAELYILSRTRGADFHPLYLPEGVSPSLQNVIAGATNLCRSQWLYIRTGSLTIWGYLCFNKVLGAASKDKFGRDVYGFFGICFRGTSPTWLPADKDFFATIYSQYVVPIWDSSSYASKNVVVDIDSLPCRSRIAAVGTTSGLNTDPTVCRMFPKSTDFNALVGEALARGANVSLLSGVRYMNEITPCGDFHFLNVTGPIFSSVSDRRFDPIPRHTSQRPTPVPGVPIVPAPPVPDNPGYSPHSEYTAPYPAPQDGAPQATVPYGPPQPRRSSLVPVAVILGIVCIAMVGFYLWLGNDKPQESDSPQQVINPPIPILDDTMTDDTSTPPDPKDPKGLKPIDPNNPTPLFDPNDPNYPVEPYDPNNPNHPVEPYDPNNPNGLPPCDPNNPAFQLDFSNIDYNSLSTGNPDDPITVRNLANGLEITVPKSAILQYLDLYSVKPLHTDKKSPRTKK